MTGKKSTKKITEEIKRLTEENQTLANKNSQLEAVLLLYSKIIGSPGLENLLNSILEVIMELYGGRNVIVYYLVSGVWHYVDIYGLKKQVNIKDTPLVLQAITGKKFIHQEDKGGLPLHEPGKTMAEHTCIFPLIISNQAAGAIVVEGMLVYNVEIIKEMEIFFRYFALALKNEIISYTNLQEAYNELDQIFRSSPDGMLFIDTESNIIRINQSLLDLLGLEKNECLNKKCWEIIKCPCCQGNSCNILKNYSTIGPLEFDLEVPNKNGEIRYCISSMRILKNRKGEPAGIINNIKDITDRKKAEEEIKNALKEKEIMLKEIHHRVKNNLQIIYSLMRLQESYLKNRESLEYFRDTAHRIRSMGIIHENLYHSEFLSRINFIDYINSLKDELLRLYRKGSEDISITIAPKPGKGKDAGLYLDIDAAIPCGLIINELISNSLKYAFPGGRKGEISIAFFQDEQQRYTLIVGDNGIGVPGDFDIYNSNSLGLELVTALVEQLDGSIDVEKDTGLKYTIKFENPSRGEEAFKKSSEVNPEVIHDTNNLF